MNTLTAYGLPKDEIISLLQEINFVLDESTNPLDKSLHSMLFAQKFVFDSNGEFLFEDELSFLGTFAKDPEFLVMQQKLIDSAEGIYFRPSLPDKAIEWGKQFLLHILKEVRAAVCEESKQSENLKQEYSNYARAFAVSISTSVLSAMGISNPAALGIATLVLITLAHATKNAFCDMTDMEVIAAIDRKITQDRSKIESRISNK